MKSYEFNYIFNKAIKNYHIKNDINQLFKNIFSVKDNLLAHLLYKKCWIDTVQWHYEDIIRLPNINPVKALELKRKIDASNQSRTEMVEYIDSYYLKLYENVKVAKNYTINTESPAWAIDRLSILALKIYHMNEQANRKSASKEHQSVCKIKLNVLFEQRKDLSYAIDNLLDDISKGKKQMKVYKQMKMYNDESLNPILYTKQHK